MMTFEVFFKAPSGHAPYEYQRRLAGGDVGRACESQIINVPTAPSRADTDRGARDKVEGSLSDEKR